MRLHAWRWKFRVQVWRRQADVIWAIAEKQCAIPKRAVRCFANGAGSEGNDLAHSGAVTEVFEEPHGRETALESLCAQALYRHAVAQAHHFAHLIFQPKGIAHLGVQRNQTIGVRTEIYDRNPLCALFGHRFIPFLWLGGIITKGSVSCFSCVGWKL